MTPTRIDIDDEALREAMRLSGVRTTTEAVNLALGEFAARHRRIAVLERYAGLAAKWDYEGWMQQRAAKKEPGDIDGWFAELDRHADVPLLEDGRSQPPAPTGRDIFE